MGSIISPPGHVYYFTVDTFLRLLDAAGFDQVDINTLGYFAGIPIIRDLAYGIRKRLPSLQRKLDKLGYGNTISALLEKRIQVIPNVPHHLRIK